MELHVIYKYCEKKTFQSWTILENKQKVSNDYVNNL